MANVAFSNDPEGIPQKCPQCGCGIPPVAPDTFELCPQCGFSWDSGSSLPSLVRPSDTQEGPIEEVLFEQARTLDGHERSEYLARACGEDQGLRQRIEELIAAADGADSLLDLAETNGFTQMGDAATTTDRLIGNYKLLEKIGEGGMGSVYLAEQLRPVERKVALKLIRAGLDSQQVVARFEAERQSLAMMDHPNIAKVLDAGETERGEPFLVMELVKGVPITQYCDENRLSPKERVNLMVDVCSAVQHAHIKGIIHRDLKPSNILIAQYDDRPVPKVIDFGVAKATHQKLTEKTLYTQLGQIVGTLEYMSPEQAVLNQLDIDTRTDVYSLGVILYELLVGETPLNGKELRSQGLEQILRTIREKEPVKPSLRLSSQGKAATQTAAYRQTDQLSLSKTLRGDLDWIVMKALEKDRKRRYDSASRLSEDLGNYLAGTAVEARPPSTAYRAQKFWQQHRRLATSIAAVFCALLIGLGAVIWQLKEKEQLLSSLHSRIFEQALLSAVLAEPNTQTLISDARETGLPKYQINILEGVERYHLGKVADGPLREALAEQPDNVIAKAMLAMALAHDGYYAEAHQHVQGLMENSIADNASAIERLFYAYPLHQMYPEIATQQYEAILDEHPTWLAARMFFAGGLAVQADENGESSLAEQAVSQARICEELGPRSPFVWTVCLYVYLVALDLDAADDRESLLRSAAGLADKLKGAQAFRLAAECRAQFLRLYANDVDAALETFEAMGESGHDAFYVFPYAATAYQKGDGKAREALSHLRPSESSLAGAAAAMLSAMLGESISPCRDDEEDSLVVMHHCWAHLFTGDKVTAAQIANRFLDRETADVAHGVYRLDRYAHRILQFIGNPDGTDFRSEIEKVRDINLHAQGDIDFTLAMYALADGNRELARQILESVSALHPYWLFSRSWAMALISRWDGDDLESPRVDSEAQRNGRSF
jgi:serine/threonine protein kinase